jgi:hypothetical protein
MGIELMIFNNNITANLPIHYMLYKVTYMGSFVELTMNYIEQLTTET